MSFNTAPTATPRVGEALHQARWIIGGFLLLLVSAVVFGLISNPTDDNQLSIHNPRPNGAMALAEVLKDRGVKVHDVYTPPANWARTTCWSLPAFVIYPKNTYRL